MIDWYQAALLAIIQGLTEFLPISSSAHLVIPALVMGWPDQGLAFDVAVHVGTLSAVVLYYRQDLWLMAREWLASLAGGPVTDNSRLVWYIGLATIPAGVVGLSAGSFIESELRSLPVIATTTLVFGLLLGVADRRAGPGTGPSLPRGAFPASGPARRRRGLPVLPVPGILRGLDPVRPGGAGDRGVPFPLRVRARYPGPAGS